MYTSWFEYNITRPYPFRWFTPLTIVGGIVFTILFSLVNLGASGFNLITIYTNDPNTTLQNSGSPWYLRPPFNWGDHLNAHCESLNIPVGYSFFTTNQGLRYEITSITRWNNKTYTNEQLPSFSYLNSTLQDCDLSQVTIDLRKADNSAPTTNWWFSWDNTVSKASAICTVQTMEGPVQLTFSTPFSTPSTDFSYVIQDNTTEFASLWWGTRLMNLYWYGILTTMTRTQLQPGSASKDWYMKGTLVYNSGSDDVKNYDYFDLVFYFLSSEGSLWNGLPSTMSEPYNRQDYPFSSVMTEGLQFARMFRSLLRVDLGNKKSPNLLLDDELLQYTLHGSDDMNRQIVNGQRGILNYTTDVDTTSTLREWTDYNGIRPPGSFVGNDTPVAVNESYPIFRNMLGPLGTKEATIYAQYACQVPQRKSMGTLILAILLANLVFLQAIWKSYKLTADSLVDKFPMAHVCRGCLGEETKAIEFERLQTRGQPSDDTESTTRLIHP